MEKEGIGRPSTYASVIGTIIDRGYVKKQANALFPTFTAMVVSKLLKNYFPEYVDLGFTSGMEQSLDHIAEGELDWEKYLKQIYFGKTGLKAQVEAQEEKIDPDEARTLKILGLDKYTFHVGRYGAYLTGQRNGDEVSASLPESESPADITAEMVEKLIDQKINGADSLGKDPATDKAIYVLNGRYGPYVQLGEISDEEDKPKRASLPPGILPENVDLAYAINLLTLPKNLGAHPETGKDVKAGLGRFGPYIVHEGDFRSIPKGTDLFSVDLKTALEMLSQPKKGRGANRTPLKILGKHPITSEDIQIFNGPYGPYFKVGKVNMSLPEGSTVDTVTFDDAVKVLAEKIKEGSPAKKAKKITAKKKSAEKKVKAPTAPPRADVETKAKSADPKKSKVMLRKK
jgi:DNA topoisomerase-1